MSDQTQPQERDIELKPCPFCGSPAELERDSDHHGSWFNLGCSQHWGRVAPDDACPGGRIWYTEPPEDAAKAITEWNRRAQPSPRRHARKEDGHEPE